jgi:hypothetical protein
MVGRPKRNPDYVEHGSERQASMLGLRKAEDEDELAYQGWTIVDVASFPPSTTQTWLQAYLRSKVNELLSEGPKYQSTDPRKPFYAPTLADV